MRTSVATVLAFTTAIVMLGSGCASLHDKDSTKATDATVFPDEDAQLGKSFAETRTLDTSVSFEVVQFTYDSFIVPPTQVSKVEAVGKYLHDNPTRVVIVDGHCDERGSNEYNLSLGEQRAEAVRAYLINMDIAASRVQTRSFGKEKPLDTGHSEAAWAKNRRGEFAIYK